MKFILMVEGKTERNSAAEFLKRWLDPQLTQPVGIQTVPFKGYARFAKEIATKARMHLEGPHAVEIIAVIGLLDLYGPNFYPGNATTADERCAWGVSHFEKAVNNPRFRMFFAVHEFEAWLLAQSRIFPTEVQKEVAKYESNPESVNFQRPPSKLLKDIYRREARREYKKTTYGKELFAKLDPVVAIAKLPNLKSMLQSMLQMAKDAGQ